MKNLLAISLFLFGCNSAAVPTQDAAIDAPETSVEAGSDVYDDASPDAGADSQE